MLILGNSKEEILKMADGSCNLIVTDPLYDMVKEDQEWYLEQFKRVCTGSILVFCSPENQWKSDKYLFWVKEPSTKNYSRNFGRFVEVIAYYPGGTYNNDLYWSNYTGVYRDTLETKRLFEYQKPTSLIERFIRILSNPGDLIFDPFMGSGSHLVAAKNLGRNYLGIEIDPVTYELAKSRIEGD